MLRRVFVEARGPVALIGRADRHRGRTRTPRQRTQGFGRSPWGLDVYRLLGVRLRHFVVRHALFRSVTTAVLRGDCRLSTRAERSLPALSPTRTPKRNTGQNQGTRSN